MRTAFIISAIAAAATAQDLSGIPGCALVCALAAGKKAGCGSGDVKCFCTSQAALSQAQSCVQSSCSESDAKKAVTGAANLCASVGVTPAVEGRSSPASLSAPASAAAVSSSTSCSTLSKTAAASASASNTPTPAQLTSSASQPATFTGGAAAAIATGARAALAGAAIIAVAAL